MPSIGPISPTPDPLDLLPGPITNWVGGSATAATANRAYLTAFQVSRPLLASAVVVAVGTQSGNLAIGIYSAAGAQLATSGSVAVGAPGTQSVPMATPVALVPGVKYFMATQLDNGTGKLVAVASSGVATGVLPRAKAYYSADTTFPLPTSIALTSSSAILYFLTVIE